MTARGLLDTWALPLLLLVQSGAAGRGGSWWSGGNSFLIVSSPEDGSISYARLLTPAEQARGEKMSSEVLVQGGRLQKPTGVAADDFAGLVFVADPAARAIFAFRVYEHGRLRSGRLTVGEPFTILTGLAARWVAVDSTGAVLCSDADDGQIWMLRADVVADVMNYEKAPQIVDSSTSDAIDLYAAGSTNSLQDPEGLAAEGGHVVWGNGVAGAASGTVMLGLKDLTDSQRTSTIVPVVSGGKPAYGVCLSSSRIFYTDGASHVFSVPASGGPNVEVSSDFQTAKGCAYDGDGTVFVADVTASKVYAFSGGGADITSRPLSVALDIPGAYGLAVLSSLASLASLSYVAASFSLAVATCSFIA